MMARTVARCLASVASGTSNVIPPIITLALVVTLAATGVQAAERKTPIDRHVVVTRHNVTLTSFGLDVPRNKQSVLQVGNGHFAFGLDVTGLQTFMLHGSFSHATLSDWCWHTAANPEGYRPEDTWIEVASGGGRTVPYASNSKHLWSMLTPEQAQRAEGAWNYLTAVNSTGSSPPQESGLFSNSWHGKFHLEMTAWHGVHFVLWDRPQLVNGWMQWMRGPGLEAAKRQAARQGYQGARWMKMIAPTAQWESPSDAGPFRMTQQGHAIYWAETMYRARPTRQTLDQFHELVQQSAEFMADYVWWDAKTGRYVLGPPLLTGSEASNWRTTCNSTVELSYWFYGLRTAQLWRERLGLPREPKWDEILAKLSKPPLVEGLCVDAENAICPANFNPQQPPKGIYPRPAWFEAYGCMRGDEVDQEAMRRTFDLIWKQVGEGHRWLFWGCDFPMLAMTAARLGKTKEALDILLSEHPNNAVLASGFNPAGSMPYLPATGGLLWATALMAAGWEGGPNKPAPGFPDDGSWVVKWEGLKKAL